MFTHQYTYVNTIMSPQKKRVLSFNYVTWNQCDQRCLFWVDVCLKKLGIESDSQVWKGALWVEVLWHIDSQRNSTSQAVARTSGAQEHNANKSVFYKCHIHCIVWLPNNIPYVNKVRLCLKKGLIYWKKVGKLISQVTVTWTHPRGCIETTWIYFTFEQMLLIMSKSE